MGERGVICGGRRVRVGTVEVVDDALGAGRVAHEDDLLVLGRDGGVFCGLVRLDVADGGGDLIRVPIEAAGAP